MRAEMGDGGGQRHPRLHVLRWSRQVTQETTRWHHSGNARCAEGKALDRTTHFAKQPRPW